MLNKLDCVGLDIACKKDRQEFFPSEESLRLLVGKSAVTFTNDVAGLVGHPNFSFAYLWSGESLLKMKENKNLSFLVHPQLSHVSKDLLSAMNNKSSTECVAREFGSAAFLDSIARESFYFSPYGKIPSKNADYNTIQNEFFSKLPELDWIHKVSIEESKQIAEKWQALKIKLQTPF